MSAVFDGLTEPVAITPLGLGNLEREVNARLPDVLCKELQHAGASAASVTAVLAALKADKLLCAAKVSSLESRSLRDPTVMTDCLVAAQLVSDRPSICSSTCAHATRLQPATASLPPRMDAGIAVACCIIYLRTQLGTQFPPFADHAEGLQVRGIR